jgi:hypothetical protein
VVGQIAAGLGYTVRALLSFLRVLPGLVGPVAVVIGIWLFDYRIALIVAGAILVVADLRIGRVTPTSKDTE